MIDTRLRALVEAQEPFAVAEIVLACFLRTVTNPKIFSAGEPDENSLDILPPTRRVATSGFRHGESHTLGPVRENV